MALGKVICSVGHFIKEPHHTVALVAGEGTQEGEVLVRTDCNGFGRFLDERRTIVCEQLPKRNTNANSQVYITLKIILSVLNNHTFTHFPYNIFKMFTQTKENTYTNDNKHVHKRSTSRAVPLPLSPVRISVRVAALLCTLLLYESPISNPHTTVVRLRAAV